MILALSSKKTACASSNEIPCFRSFAAAFPVSHSNRGDMLKCNYNVGYRQEAGAAWEDAPFAERFAERCALLASSNARAAAPTQVRAHLFHFSHDLRIAKSTECRLSPGRNSQPFGALSEKRMLSRRDRIAGSTRKTILNFFVSPIPIFSVTRVELDRMMKPGGESTSSVNFGRTPRESGPAV